MHEPCWIAQHADQGRIFEGRVRPSGDTPRPEPGSNVDRNGFIAVQVGAHTEYYLPKHVFYRLEEVQRAAAAMLNLERDQANRRVRYLDRLLLEDGLKIIPFEAEPKDPSGS